MTGYLLVTGVNSSLQQIVIMQVSGLRRPTLRAHTDGQFMLNHHDLHPAQRGDGGS
jgi:hypothetical protein